VTRTSSDRRPRQRITWLTWTDVGGVGVRHRLNDDGMLSADLTPRRRSQPPRGAPSLPFHPRIIILERTRSGLRYTGFRRLVSLSIRSFLRLTAHIQMTPVLECGEEILVGGQAVHGGCQ